MGKASRRLRRSGLAVVAVVPAFALAACGGVDTGKLDDAINSSIQKQAPGATNISVSCPSNIPDQPTHIVTCPISFTHGGQKLTGTATATIDHTNLTNLRLDANPS